MNIATMNLERKELSPIKWHSSATYSYSATSIQPPMPLLSQIYLKSD